MGRLTCYKDKTIFEAYILLPSTALLELTCYLAPDLVRLSIFNLLKHFDNRKKKNLKMESFTGLYFSIGILSFRDTSVPQSIYNKNILNLEVDLNAN